MYLLQVVAIVIYSLVLVCALRDFKRTIIMWVPISLLFNPQVCPIYSPAISLNVVVNLTLIFLFFTLKKKTIRKEGNNERFSLYPFMVFMLLSVFISMLFSEIPFMASFNKLIKSTVMDYCIVYIFFRCINSLEDIRLFVKSCLFIALLITLDGLVENFTHINPAGDFIYLTSPHNADLVGRSYYVPSFISGSYRQRFGLTRCYSFFSLHISFGVSCVLLFFLLITCMKNSQVMHLYKNRLNRFLHIIAIVLLCIGVVLSNSKTPMLGIVICLFAYYKIKNIFNIKVIFPLLAVLVLILVYIPEYLNNFLSLTDKDIAAEGGGSTVDGRMDQLQYVIKLFQNNPICGNGIGSTSYFRQVTGFEGILGAESIWFQLACDQGIIGFLAYIYRYKVTMNFCRSIIPKRIVFYYSLSFLTMETATGNLNLILWFSILFVIRRYYQLSIFNSRKIVLCNEIQ